MVKFDDRITESCIMIYPTVPTLVTLNDS